jgi:hypothetical protein
MVAYLLSLDHLDLTRFPESGDFLFMSIALLYLFTRPNASLLLIFAPLLLLLPNHKLVLDLPILLPLFLDLPTLQTHILCKHKPTALIQSPSR